MDNFNLKRGERLVLEGGYFSTPCILCATASICSREQKKSVREGAFWPFSGLCVRGNIHQASTLVWWYKCSESGDKCEVWADCSQVNGEFWTNWRIGGERRKVKEPTFSPPRNSKWVSPLFLCVPLPGGCALVFWSPLSWTGDNIHHPSLKRRGLGPTTLLKTQCKINREIFLHRYSLVVSHNHY